MLGQGQPLVPLDQPAFALQAGNQPVENRLVDRQRLAQLLQRQPGAFRRLAVEIADALQNPLLRLRPPYRGECRAWRPTP